MFIPGGQVDFAFKNVSIYHIKWLKEEKVISIDVEKSFDKKSMSIQGKNRKLGTEGNFLSMIKDIYKSLTSNIIYNGKILNISPKDQK